MDGYEIRKAGKKGKGVFALKGYRKGEVVECLEGKPVGERTEYSVQVGPSKHIDTTSPVFLNANHSCNPNCGIKIGKNGMPCLTAMAAIKKGEEIAWDYAMTEWEFSWKMPCLCESRNCRKMIDGYKYLDDKTKKKYNGWVMPYLVEMDK